MSDRGRDWRTVTRRGFVAGAAACVAGRTLGDGETAAAFRDEDGVTGTVRVDGDPTLNYQIVDQTANNNAEYEIYTQVEWMSSFDRVEIQVENLDAGHISGETLTQNSKEGWKSYPRGGGSDGGAAGDTYRFTFRVYETGSSSPVIQKTREDTADGDGQQDGDFSSPNDPKLESVYVTDETQYNNTDYTVEYEVSDYQNGFGEVRVTFDNRANDWSDATKSSSSTPTGTVSYAQGGTEDDTYDIVVEVKNENGLTVDSTTVTDVANGSDSQWTR